MRSRGSEKAATGHCRGLELQLKLKTLAFRSHHGFTARRRTKERSRKRSDLRSPRFPEGPKGEVCLNSKAERPRRVKKAGNDNRRSEFLFPMF